MNAIVVLGAAGVLASVIHADEGVKSVNRPRVDDRGSINRVGGDGAITLNKARMDDGATIKTIEYTDRLRLNKAASNDSVSVNRYGAGEPELRIFDVRDLVAAIGQHGDPTGMSLMATTGSALELRCLPVAHGVFAMQGDSGALDSLNAVLEGLRIATRGRYQVEISAATFDAATSPQLGRPMPSNGTVMTRLQHIVQRRVETVVRSTSTESFIHTWSPIVSEQSVGYEARVESIEHGLDARLTVGAGPEGAEAIEVSISGELSHATIASVTQPVISSDSLLSYGLPTVHARSIEAALAVMPGQSVVVSVVDGFEPGRVIAIAVKVSVVE